MLLSSSVEHGPLTRTRSINVFFQFNSSATINRQYTLTLVPVLSTDLIEQYKFLYLDNPLIEGSTLTELAHKMDVIGCPRLVKHSFLYPSLPSTIVILPTNRHILTNRYSYQSLYALLSLFHQYPKLIIGPGPLPGTKLAMKSLNFPLFPMKQSPKAFFTI